MGNPDPGDAWAFQHIRAKNDRNGNPQRLYLIFAQDGQTLGAIDEGYSGIGAIARAFGWDGHKGIRKVRDTLRELTSISVPVSEYRTLLRLFEQRSQKLSTVEDSDE